MLAVPPATVPTKGLCSRTSVITAARKKGGSTQTKQRKKKRARQEDKSTLEKVRTGDWEESEKAAAQDRAAEAYPSTSQQGLVDDGIVDTVVTDRMLRRILTFSGVPVVVAFLLYPAFYYLKVVKGVDLPTGLVFVVQSITFGVALLGITYGATSASWDPSRKGSALGWTEFQANFAAIMGKFGRS